jgi:hypothetical protein
MMAVEYRGLTKRTKPEPQLRQHAEEPVEDGASS